MAGNFSNVSSAFEMLLEELDAEVELVNGAGSKAFASGDYERVDEARDRARDLLAFRRKASDLRQDWEALAAAQQEDDEETQAARQNLGRLRRGLRTPEAAYRLPILRALDEMDGRGRIGDVLARVLEEVRPLLKDVDFEPLASDPNLPRWRNAAQWARNGLREEGLIADGSPHGIWEISDAGREYLSRNS